MEYGVQSLYFLCLVENKNEMVKDVIWVNFLKKWLEQDKNGSQWWWGRDWQLYYFDLTIHFHPSFLSGFEKKQFDKSGLKTFESYHFSLIFHG